jgi:cell division septum initiation protein DivIVA
MGPDSREYDPKDEMEDLPPLNELEQLQEDYSELRKKNKAMKEQLQKLAQFEESIRTFGFLSYEEQTEKNEILKQYL